MSQTFSPTFTFKHFAIDDRHSALKIGTDGVLLGAWAQASCPSPSILDVGAGSGLISLMLAQRYAHATITGVEIDPGSAGDMRMNVINSPWSERITTIAGDFTDIAGKYDLIVSNPPFFTTGEKAPDSARARARHAGSLSPVSLLAFANSHLNPDGILSMIYPTENDLECSTLIMEAALAGMSLSRLDYVSTSPRRGVTRALLEFTNKPAPIPVPGMIVIGDSIYRNLTKDFYL